MAGFWCNIQHPLSFADLQQYKAFYRLPTLILDKFILIPNNSVSNFTLDGSGLAHPDIYTNAAIAIRGIDKLLDYSVFGAEPGKNYSEPSYGCVLNVKIASLQLEAATKILARQLVRLRQQITNLQGSRAQIRGVATHTQALYASTSISTGMKGATKAMVAMNKIEMMSEAIDETLDKDEAEEETEELTNQVLDEIGVDIASQLSSAPKGRIASKNAPPMQLQETEHVNKGEEKSFHVCYKTRTTPLGMEVPLGFRSRRTGMASSVGGDGGV
ncbi:Vacuolar sorting-associated protein [Salix suchowensis]|nr:Vacuolar sorting-associated protein [Salix suchowensis]